MQECSRCQSARILGVQGLGFRLEGKSGLGHWEGGFAAVYNQSAYFWTTLKMKRKPDSLSSRR